MLKVTIDPADNGYIAHVFDSDNKVKGLTYVATTEDDLLKILRMAFEKSKEAKHESK